MSYKCEKCRDTGVWDTGNNDLPCECPAGKTALFNVAGVKGTVTGAEMERHLFNTSPQPMSSREFDALRQDVEKAAFDRLQAEMGTWCDQTFPNATPETIQRHLKKEVQELWDAPKAERPEEIADCIMLLLHLAHKDGISARDALRDKFEVCKKRKWGKPDEHGVVEHIREES